MGSVSPQNVRAEARRRYPRSKGLQSAFVRGWSAARNGRAQTANPYRDPSGWGTSWRKAWGAGWRAGA